MTDNKDRPAKWNAGWFGMQLGSSAWMLGLIFIAPSPFSLMSASGVFTFLMINIIGTYMWMHSGKIDIHVAFIILIGIAALGCFSLLVIMDVSGILHQWEPRFSNPRHAYWLMLLFPWRAWQLRNRGNGGVANKRLVGIVASAPNPQPRRSP